MKKENFIYIYIVICCCLLAGGIIGIPNAYGLFYEPMAHALNIGKGSVSFHMTISGLITAILTPLVIRCIKHTPSRIIFLTGIICIGLSGYIIAFSTNISLINLFSIIRGIGFSCCTSLFITLILGNWFEKHRGKVTGIAMSFSGLLGALSSPILSSIIDQYGYQTGYIFSIVCIIICVLPCVIFCPLTPQEIGLKPYGVISSKDNRPNKSSSATFTSFNVTSQTFIFLSIMAIEIVAITSLNTHLPSIAASLGFNDSTSATLLSVAMLANVTAKFIIGILIDNLGPFKSVVIMMSINALGMIMLITISSTPLLLLISGFLYGAIYSVSAVGVPAVIREIYGNSQYGAAYSIISMLTSIITSLSISFIGLSYDIFHGYSVALIIAIVFSLTSLFFLKLGYKSTKQIKI